MNEIKKLTKSTIIYFWGTVGTKLISFLLLPVYTFFIAPEFYGTYDYHVTLALLFSSFFFLDIWTAIMKFIFEREGEEEKTKVVYNGITIFISSAILYTFVLGVFGVINKIEYLPGVIAYGFFLCLQELYCYLARAYGFNFRFAVSGIFATLCNAVLNIFLLAVLKLDYCALYISYAAGILLQCIILEYKLRIIPSFRFKYVDKKYLKILLRFSLPLCINELCYWLLTGYNRVVINQYLNSEANGFYAVASRFGGILTIVFSCFSMAWQELAYGKFGRDEETGKFYSDATTIYIKALTCGFIVLIPLIYIIFPYMVAAEYVKARKLIPVSMLAALASILFTFLGNIISTYKKNEKALISTFVACTINILSLHLLISRFGVQASNISLFAGYLMSDIIRVKTINNEVKFRPDPSILLYVIPLIVITCLIFWNGNVYHNLIWGITGILVSLYLFRTLFKVIFGKLVNLLYRT